jgi:hypothetical protein
MSHDEGQQNEGDASHTEGEGNIQPQQSQAAAAHVQALQRRKIAQLEEKLGILESGRAVKER